jgi:hypothetical protein
MSQDSPESLGSGEEVCALSPLCEQRHEVWTCAKFTQLLATHRHAIAITQRVCLICCLGAVEEDEVCLGCGGDDEGSGEHLQVRVPVKEAR